MKRSKTNNRFAKFYHKICSITGTVLRPLKAAIETLPRLWTRITGWDKHIGLYRQEFKNMELVTLLAAVNSVSGKKAKKSSLCALAPGTVRLNGSFLWAGRTREHGTK
jgi:hypothetical protein